MTKAISLTIGFAAVTLIAVWQFWRADPQKEPAPNVSSSAATKAASHSWKEPDSFLGIKFFTDPTKALKECTKEQITASLAPSYKIYDSSQGHCWEERSDGRYEIRYVDLFSHVYAYTVDRKLAFLDCDFHWEMYPRLAAVFRERYGVPSRTQYETLTNALGATFRNEILSWDGKQISISIRQHTTSLDRGQAIYETQLWRDHSAKTSNDWVKKSAKGL